MTRYQWEDHYRTGPTPWDTGSTPPEVVQFWQNYPVPPNGLAFDLGCGTGTNVAYLATLGLTVIGFDLAGNALALGQKRLHGAATPRLQLIQADVTTLPVRAAQAHYILDIGCLHGLPVERRPAYAQGVIDNLRPGGYYQLFAFDRLPPSAQPPDKPPRGMGDDEVQTLFAPTLTLVEIIRARPDRQPCRWYVLQKRS
jgi:methyl halide transferase